MKPILFILCIATSILAGCHNDIQKEYPDYPKWGWWDNHVPLPETEPLEDKKKAAAARPPRVNEMPERLGERSENPAARSERPSVRTPKQEPIPEIHDAVALNDYRKKRWRAISVLQNLDDLSTEQRQKTLASIQANLPAWYKPLGLKPPNITDENWTLTVLWDFMPDESFFRAVKGWRAIAEEDKLPFPDPVTRRSLLKFILDRIPQNP